MNLYKTSKLASLLFHLAGILSHTNAQTNIQNPGPGAIENALQSPISFDYPYYLKSLLVTLLILLPFFVRAQLEIYGRYTTGGSVEPNINYTRLNKITDKISLTFFGLVEQKWSEALIGVTYSPSNACSIGASTGVEHGTKSPRFGASIWTGKGKISFLILGELGSGKDNYLYKANLFHKYSEKFTLGITAWRYHGVGPNFRFTISKLPLTIWSMPAYDFEANTSRLMVGVSMNM